MVGLVYDTRSYYDNQHPLQIFKIRIRTSLWDSERLQVGKRSRRHYGICASQIVLIRRSRDPPVCCEDMVVGRRIVGVHNGLSDAFKGSFFFFKTSDRNVLYPASRNIVEGICHLAESEASTVL